MSAPNKTIKCVVLGGGGHAAVVIDAILSSGCAKPCAVLDNDSALSGKNILGVPIIGGDDLLDQLSAEGIQSFIIGLGSIGQPEPRQRLYELAQSKGLTAISAIHLGATVAMSARIGMGTVICAGAVINPEAIIGANTIINTGAIVEHHCHIGIGTHVATGACMGGKVRIGAGAHIGAGAVIRQGIKIGEAAMVAAGAVVINNVESNTTVMGNPAKVRKESDL